MSDAVVPVAEDALWCDSFDLDLLKVVPGVDDVVGELGALRLHTRSGETNGRINCPAQWNTDRGAVAFFSTLDRDPTPPGYHTAQPLVECTFLEVLRDEWVHGAAVAVNRSIVWVPPIRLFEKLLAHTRGWARLDDEAHLTTQAMVLGSLDSAVTLVDRVVAT